MSRNLSHRTINSSAVFHPNNNACKDLEFTRPVEPTAIISPVAVWGSIHSLTVLWLAHQVLMAIYKCFKPGWQIPNSQNSSWKQLHLVSHTVGFII